MYVYRAKLLYYRPLEAIQRLIPIQSGKVKWAGHLILKSKLSIAIVAETWNIFFF